MRIMKYLHVLIKHFIRIYKSLEIHNLHNTKQKHKIADKFHNLLS